jgi:benzylsuccinate CoA-transferase BbsE subunit
MPELRPVDATAPDAPLHGVHVVEAAGSLCDYAGRLFADLGATVTRVRPVGRPAPHWTALRGKLDLPLGSDSDAELGALVRRADVVLVTESVEEPAPRGLSAAEVEAANPSAVHVTLTPFGLSGPAAGLPSTDLTRLAAGGLLWLGGYPDAEPVAAHGEQSTQAVGIYGVVAALLALIERDRTGRGSAVEVSAQEVVTQALETALADYELAGVVRSRVGDAQREAATGVYPCADGWVSMVAGRLGTAEAWRRLREWLVEEGIEGAETLWEPDWESLPFRQRPESIARFGEIFGRFAATRTKAVLYEEAQARSIALAPVNAPHDVLANPQLAARGFFREVADLVSGERALAPVSPFRFSPLAPAVEPALVEPTEPAAA